MCAGGRGGNAGCTTHCCCIEPWAAMCGFSTCPRGSQVSTRPGSAKQHVLSFPRPVFLVQMYCRSCCCSHLNSDASHGGCDTCVPLPLRPEETMLLRTPPGTPPPRQQWQFLSSRHLLVESSQVQAGGGCQIEDVASTCSCCSSRELRKFQQDDPIHEIARQCLQQQLQVHGKQQVVSFHVLRRRQEQGSGASLSSETTCDSHGHGPLQDASTESHRRQPFST